jgi:addiction module RelE/StbE family toxin
MGKKIVWSPEAMNDLKGIHDYIARDSEFFAASLVERILSSIDRLANYPLMGPRIREWSRSAYRHLVIPPYRVIYRVSTDMETVHLITIIHGSRDLKKALRRDK